MHWIDPDSLPETSGTLERFVMNGQARSMGSSSPTAATMPLWFTYRRISAPRSRLRSIRAKPYGCATFSRSEPA